MGTGDHVPQGAAAPHPGYRTQPSTGPWKFFLNYKQHSEQQCKTFPASPAPHERSVQPGWPGGFGNSGRATAWQMLASATPSPAVLLLPVPKPHPSGISLQCKNSLQSSWHPPFPAFSKQTAHSTSHPRAGTTSLAAAATAATPLPEHVCRHGLSNLCRAPKHVDPQMLHLLLSNCKKFTGSSRIPSPEFRGGSRVRISLSGIPHRRQYCAPPGFSPPSKQGFAPQNLHPGYDPPFPNTSQPGQGRCEPGRGLSGMRTPHALQNPARPAARHGSLRGYRGHSRSCSPPRALR